VAVDLCIMAWHHENALIILSEPGRVSFPHVDFMSMKMRVSLLRVDEAVRVSFPYIVVTIASNTPISCLTIKSQNAYGQVLSEPILLSSSQEN